MPCGAPRTTQFVRSLLRETAATRLLENELDIRFVQRLLRHQSIFTTEIYTAVTDTRLKTAIGRAAGRRSGGLWSEGRDIAVIVAESV